MNIHDWLKDQSTEELLMRRELMLFDGSGCRRSEDAIRAFRLVEAELVRRQKEQENFMAGMLPKQEEESAEQAQEDMANILRKQLARARRFPFTLF